MVQIESPPAPEIVEDKPRLSALREKVHALIEDQNLKAGDFVAEQSEVSQLGQEALSLAKGEQEPWLFGKYLLDQLNDLDATGSGMHHPELRKKYLDFAREDLTRHLEEREDKEHIEPLLRAELIACGAISEDIPAVDAAVIADLSDEAMDNFLFYHVERFLAYAGEHKDDLDSYYREFVATTENLIEQGKLPLTKTDFHNRLKGLSYGFSDYLDLMLSDNHGTYEVGLNKILVATQLSPGKLRHVLNHELVHAISGRTFKVADKVSKGGLKFLDYECGLDLWDKALALNEGITEWLASGLSGHPPMAYQLAISVWQDILRERPELATNVFKGYFNSLAPRPDAVIQTRRMIDEALGPDYMTTIILNRLSGD